MGHHYALLILTTILCKNYLSSAWIRTCNLCTMTTIRTETFLFIFKKGLNLVSFNLFSSFQTHITNFITNRYLKKCPPSIWCKNSNSQPLEHESPPLTTRPGLPPTNIFIMLMFVPLPNVICILK